MSQMQMRKSLLRHVCEMKAATAAIRAETGTLNTNGVGLQAADTGAPCR